MRKAAIAIAFVALLVASGCGKTGEQQAANVNGSVITDKDVVTELKAIAANTELVNRLEENGTKISGTTKGSFDPSFAAQVIANSRYTAGRVRRLYRREADAVVYPGVDLDLFRPDSHRVTAEPSYAITVGRLSPEKGLDRLLDVWRDIPDLPLHVVGAGLPEVVRELRAHAPKG